MMAILTTGNGFMGAVRYDSRAGKKIDPADVKILDASGVNFDYDKEGEIVIDERQVGRDFRIQALSYQGRVGIRKPVYHWALSYHEKDHPSEEQMVEDAKEFMRRIGFGETQYLTTVHYDKPHSHLHIVTNIVNNQFRRIPTVGLIDKAHAAAAAITKNRGYTWGEETKKENINADRIHKPHDRARKVIESKIREALTKCTNLHDLQRMLIEEYDIMCNYTTAADGKRGRISFCFEYEGVEHSFKGSSIAKDLSFGYIKAELDTMGEKNKKEKAATEKMQELRGVWRTQLAPMYTRSVQLCSELYERKTETWNRVSRGNRDISEQFENVKNLKGRASDLQYNIDSAANLNTLTTAIAAALFFINPLLALALKVTCSAIVEADSSANIEQRKAVREEMSQTFEKIRTLKEQQKNLRADAREALKDYRENKNEKEAFRDAYYALKTNLSAPVVEEKFNNISNLHPETTSNLQAPEQTPEFETKWEYGSASRIVRRADGKFELQTKKGDVWNKQKGFKSYEVLREGKDYGAIKLVHSNGRLEYVNHSGETLTGIQKRNLGLIVPGR